MRGSRRLRHGNCRDCGGCGRPITPRCHPAPRPRPLYSPVWRAGCSIQPMSTTTVSSPGAARCSSRCRRASKTRPSAARSACAWATISARCASSSTPKPMSSSRSIATTASGCGTSATTRRPPETSSTFRQTRCGSGSRNQPTATPSRQIRIKARLRPDVRAGFRPTRAASWWPDIRSGTASTASNARNGRPCVRSAPIPAIPA